MPMAGEGSRFKSKGYLDSKPYIQVNHKPMFVNALKDISTMDTVLFVINERHMSSDKALSLINEYFPNNKVYAQFGTPTGPVSSTLAAKDAIDNENGLLLLDCDQITDWNMPETNDFDGFVVVFESDQDNYSYVLLDNEGYITDIKEKEVISPYAVCGIYFWSKGSEYVKYAEDLLLDKTIEEYYASYVINKALKDGLKFKAVFADKFIPFNTPLDLEGYLNGTV